MADRFKGFAEECMAEYNLDGWTVLDLTDPGALSYHMMKEGGKGRVREVGGFCVRPKKRRCWGRL